jgi:hypothetical protein
VIVGYGRTTAGDRTRCIHLRVALPKVIAPYPLANPSDEPWVNVVAPLLPAVVDLKVLDSCLERG